MIASCDHQHCLHLEAAIKAKKDAYVRKAAGHEHGVAQPRLSTWSRPPGSWSRWAPRSAATRPAPAARSSSSRAPSARSRGSSSAATAPSPIGTPGCKDRPEVKAEDVDWKEFLMDRPMRPFDAQAADRLVRIPRIHRRPDRQPGLPLHRPVQLHRRLQAADQLRGPGRHLHLEGREASPVPTTARPSGSIPKASWSATPPTSATAAAAC